MGTRGRGDGRGDLDQGTLALLEAGASPVDASEFSALVLALCAATPPRVNDCERLLARLGSRSLSPAAGRALVRALVATQRVEQAVALFRELQAAGVELPTATFTDLIACVPAARRPVAL